MADIEQKLMELMRAGDTQAVERLELLRLLGMNRLDIFEGDLSSRIGSPGAFDGELEPKTLYQFIGGHRFNVGADAAAHVRGVVDSIFQPDVAEVMTRMIRAVMAPILEADSVGPTERAGWFVSVDSGAITRTDVLVWRYGFGSGPIVPGVKNILCYGVARSIVDLPEPSASTFRSLLVSSLGLDSVEDIADDDLLAPYVDLLVAYADRLGAASGDWPSGIRFRGATSLSPGARPRTLTEAWVPPGGIASLSGPRRVVFRPVVTWGDSDELLSAIDDEVEFDLVMPADLRADWQTALGIDGLGTASIDADALKSAARIGRLAALGGLLSYALTRRYQILYRAFSGRFRLTRV